MRLALAQSGDQAVMLVEDTGIGVPLEDRSLLFQRFHRGRNAARYPGNGLGLAIVLAIAQAHGGTVTLADTPQGGGFRLCLPLNLSSAPA